MGAAGLALGSHELFGVLLTTFASRRRRPATLMSQPAAPSDAFEAAPPSAAAIDDATFTSLGIAPDLVATLLEAGIDAPFPVQVMTIPDALAGRDVCGKAKTGSGKTLAFGLPLVQRTRSSARRRPRGLVLVPTRELANQVTEELVPLVSVRGLWITAIYGGVSMNRQIRALHEGVDIVVATPGRLNDLLQQGELSLEDVATVVLDEADQMADMGFLPQVERILAHVPGDAQTLLFSATLDGAVGALVRKYQHDPVHHEVASPTITVDELEQRFIGVTSETKIAVAARILAGAPRALVFVRTTHGADRLVRQLEREGLRPIAIHGRMSQAKRERALAAFTRGTSPVLVATNVAARGLHVDGIDLVLNFDPPEDHKVYLHRSGRTARAGEGGMVVTLVLREEESEMASIERAAGIDYAFVSMHPDDPRLNDLAAWDPPRGLPQPARTGGNPRASRPQRSAPAPRRQGSAPRRPRGSAPRRRS